MIDETIKLVMMDLAT